MSERYDIAILGGGPGGYVAAIRAAQLGFSTVVIDKDNLGGVCLNWGCIPTKSLLKNAELYSAMRDNASDFGISFKELSFDFAKIVRRSRDISSKISKNVELLVNKNKIDRLRGFGVFKDRNTIAVLNESGAEMQIVSAERIIIATGARPRELPQIPIDRKYIITSSEAMSLDALPADLVIIGGGAIGIEFAYFYNAFGTKVTIIEALDSVLPIEDAEVSKELEKKFRRSGIDIFTSASVEKALVNGERVEVAFSHKGESKVISAEKVLSAIGVTGNTEGFGLDVLGIELERNHIKVDKKSYRTSVENIYAIGDVIGPPWLAHVASAEGVACIENIKGLHSVPVDYGNVPGCTYCQPQVASVGMTEKKAIEAGYKIKVGKFPFMASGKAFAIGERDGFVKLIFDEKYGELLGAHIIGSEATEMIAELVLAKSHGATAGSIIKTIHSHPTLSEAVMEAAAQAYGEAIHI